ncbi:MAG: endolytic transglycosylase MltG [Bacillota bacterium]|nr:endolytic transglycosylase MltG [Bacillota bacterium]
MSELKVNKKKPRIFVPIILLLLFAGTTFFVFQFMGQFGEPVDVNDQSDIEVQIPENSSARQVAAILLEKNLIKSERAFLSYSRSKGLDSQLKAGDFRLRRSQSLEQIVEELTRGQIQSITLTIPEGYTVEQIGGLLLENKICTDEEWEKAIQFDYDYNFLTTNAQNSRRLEGFLFPDTYAVDELTKAQQIIETMLDRFENVWEQELADQAEAKGITVQEAVTIASLIEREAMVAEERSIISGVIQNRLAIGMPLQLDATVLYSLGRHQEVVSYADLEVESPYNTYLNPGLPPGSIACPGMASLQAALNPQEHDYFYYVSRGDGSHEFTRTYAEHNQARRKYGM